MAKEFGFDLKGAAIHIGVATLIGGTISYFTDAKWLAASFWVSAATFINGSLAVHEDARPGGFDNPNGADTPDSAKGIGTTKYWIVSLAVISSLVAAGYLAQTFPWS